MHESNDIQQELKELQVDLPPRSEPAFALPDGYFEQFHNNLKEHIHTEDFLHDLPKDTPYDLPEDYFESLSEDLSNQLFLENLPKNMPFFVSSDYFHHQHEELLRQTTASEKPLSPLRVTLRKLAPLSMAASIALLLGIGYLMMSPSQSPSIEQQVATLSTSEIESYIQQHQLEFDTDLSVDLLDDNQVDLRQLETDILDQNLNQLSDEELSTYIL